MLHIDMGIPLLRFVLGFVFLWSGGVKLGDLRGFAAIARSYALVPRFLGIVARWGSYAVPFTELLAGGLLIIGEFEVVVLWYVILSLAGYTILESYELLSRGGKDNCGCYGTTLDIELTWTQVGKNILLMVLAIGLLLSL